MAEQNMCNTTTMLLFLQQTDRNSAICHRYNHSSHRLLWMQH